MSAARHTLLGSVWIGVASAILLWGAAGSWLPISVLEAFGFASGALCVWLVTRENHWKWPIGLANNIKYATPTHLPPRCGTAAIWASTIPPSPPSALPRRQISIC